MKRGASGGPRLGRRGFLAAASSSAALFVIPFRLGATETAGAAGFTANAFLRLDAKGVVVLSLPKTEMGQSVYTAIAMLVAEELEVGVGTIAVELPDGEEGRFGEVTQETGGSTSIRETFFPVRQAAADMRASLVGAAAAGWGVAAKDCTASDGRVVHAASGREAHFGALASAAAARPPAMDTQLKDSSKFAVIGKPTPRLDSRLKVMGEAIYGIDVVLPGMKIGAIAQCPAFGGRLESTDRQAALAVAGVVEIVVLTDAVAVIADHYWAAKKGLDALAPVWTSAAEPDLDQARIEGEYAAAAATGKGFGAEGTTSLADVADGLASAHSKFSADEQQPFHAHEPMEPGNYVLHLHNGELEIWTGTQIPADARAAAAGAAGLPVEKVKLRNQLMGGGFGRRLEPDFIVRAVEVAKSCPYPLKLIWSREEDMQHDMYRPYYHDRVEAAVDAEGLPVAIFHRIAGSSIMARLYGDEFDGVDSDAVDGAAVTPYKLPRHRVEFVRHETLVPTSWWRGVGGARSAFVVESFVDELARNAKADPLIYRRRLLESDRARAVLDLVAEKARWTQDPGKDRARGVSIIHLWNTFMAQVVEVGRSDDGVRVERVIVAVDCGQPVNPLGIEAQIEGGVIFGLSAALSGEITIADGRVEQSNFHDYTVFRMTDAPRIDIHIVDSTAEVGGLGEPPVAAVMPALANAVCALTGKRIRRLPILKTLAV